MRLNINDWKEFEVRKLFKISTTKMSVKDDLPEGNIPFISRTAENNGCDGYVNVNINKISKGNCLTIGAEGIYCFYQPKDFATGNKIYTLRNKNLTPQISLFITTILNKEDYKYSYGRARIKSKLEKEIIKLPIQYNPDDTPYIDITHKYSNKGYVPDWQFMENYIKSLHYKPLLTNNKFKQIPNLNINNWKEFEVKKLFKISTTKMSVKDDLPEGNIPFISRTAENNGCDGYVNVNINKISKGNCLTIGAEGIYCFYQPKDFATGNKIYTLRNKNLTPQISLFITTILNKEDYKYSYGRARIKSKLEKEIIKLPIQYNLDNTPYIDLTYKYSNKGYVPDWQFMENYIKSLPYGDRL